MASGDGHPQRVEVHARSGQPGAGEGQQVAPDAAPQVDDAGGSGGREAGRAVLGDAEPGRLLERVGGEEHARRQVAELRDRPGAQLHLGRGRRGPVGVRLEAAYRRRGADRVTAMIDPCPGRLLQQPPAGIGLQPGQRLEVHGRILSGGSVSSSPPTWQVLPRAQAADRPRARAPDRRPGRRWHLAVPAGGAGATTAGTLVEQPVDGLLVGRSTDVRVPWGRLQVTVTEPLDSVETDTGTLRGSFVGIQVELRDTEDSVPVDRAPGASLEDPVFGLEADGETWELPALSGWVDGIEVAPGARREYVALPADAEKVTVTMTYDGVTQTIDAATADVSVGDAAPLYDAPSPSPGGPCGDQLWSPGAAALDGAGSACFVLGSATHPYVAGLGWAPEGSRWLVVTVVPGPPTAFETRRGPVEARASDVETSYALGFDEPVEV